MGEHLVNGGRPSTAIQAELLEVSTDFKTYLRDWDKLVMKNRVIYRKKHTRDDQEILQLVLPSQKRKEAIQGLHDQAGHMG